MFVKQEARTVADRGKLQVAGGKACCLFGWLLLEMWQGLGGW